MNLSLEKSHISYKAIPKLYDICAPVFDAFDIGFMRYVRAYSDRSRFVLCTDTDWLDKYFELQHYQYEFVNFDVWPKDNFNGHGIWVGCTDDHKMCRIWNYFKENKQFGFNLLIYNKTDDMIELIDFNSKSINPHIPSTLLANLDIFKQFTYFFKEQAKDIIKEADASRFTVPVSKEPYNKPHWFFGLSDEQKKYALSQMPIKRYYLSGKYLNSFITNKELECLKELVKGKTQEEIGTALNISRRTVEYRLNNLKTKLDCKNQGELVMRAQEEEVAEILRLTEDDHLMMSPMHLP